MPLVTICKQGSQHFIEAGWIFGQQHTHRAPLDLDAFAPSKGRFELFYSRDYRGPGHVKRVRGGDGGQRVIDIVQPRQRHRNLALLAGQLNLDAQPVKAIVLYPSGDYLWPGPLLTAVGTVIMPDMAIEAHSIGILASAV